jgi:hypothetical protein
MEKALRNAGETAQDIEKRLLIGQSRIAATPKKEGG